MQELNVALLAIGGLILALSLVAGLLSEKAYILSEPMAATLLGMVIGPLGFGWVELTTYAGPSVLLEQFARFTVGLAVTAAALRLPERYFRRNARSMAAVLLPGMVGSWLVSSAVVYLLLGVDPLVALLVGAILTPTDPVLAGTIVTGSTAKQYIPEAVRDLLSGEAGANDGLAYPLVFLPILLLEYAPRQALEDWFLETLLWEVGLAILAGAAAGAAAGAVERWSSDREYLEETSLLSATVALTFAVLGGVKLLGSDGILAAFVAGLLFNRFADPGDETDEQRIQETVLRLFTFPVFVLFGVVAPFEEWVAFGWIGVALVVAVLLLRRVPMAVVFDRAVDPLEDRRDALFAGWFGPIGIAALFYATVAQRLLGVPTVWTAVSLVVAGSIVAHGVTATPLTKLYGRAVGRGRERGSDSESSTFGGG